MEGSWSIRIWKKIIPRTKPWASERLNDSNAPFVRLAGWSSLRLQETVVERRMWLSSQSAEEKKKTKNKKQRTQPLHDGTSFQKYGPALIPSITPETSQFPIGFIFQQDLVGFETLSLNSKGFPFDHSKESVPRLISGHCCVASVAKRWHGQKMATAALRFSLNFK